MITVPIITGVDEVVAVAFHRGAAAATIRRFKYGRTTATVTGLADSIARIAPPADVVTWVPSTPRHRRGRGFDPSELLARAVARRIDRPVRRLLRRADRRPQTARDRSGRRRGPDLRPRRRVSGLAGATVLVVDDVCTTGSTLRAAAAVLRRSGARSVVAAVATRSSLWSVANPLDRSLP